MKPLYAPLVASASLLLLTLPSACGREGQRPENLAELRDPKNDIYGEDYIGFMSVDGETEAAASLSGTGGTSAGPLNGDFAGTGGSFAGDGDGDIAFGGASFGGASSDFAPRGATLEPGPFGPLDYPIENPFFAVEDSSTSTFSIDVDSASYTLARASINAGYLPAQDSVRVEEFLNYFHFHYKQPEGDEPLALYTEWSKCPWNPEHDLLLLGLQGQEVALEDQPPLNLVYLLDTSGSMRSDDKLPLLKKGFRLLSSLLRPQDKVSIVTYAGNETVVLEGATGLKKEVILDALDTLEAGGSTNGAGGIQKAYEIAQEHFVEGGNNRVLLATDGDFNVGISDTEELKSFIAEKRDTGVFLSVYGYGASWNGGNFRDDVGETLADNGNGVYFYIDGQEETLRAFGYAMSGSLLTVAKDVKLQVAFSPQHVKGYRLIGYENRVLTNQDFDNDAIDAGELNAGLSVTALYEIIPADSNSPVPEPAPGTVPEVLLNDGSTTEDPDADYEPPTGSEMAQVRLRFKRSQSTESELFVTPVTLGERNDAGTRKFFFAASLSEFAMQLRGSQYLERSATSELVQTMSYALPLDKDGAVKQAIELLQAAQRLK